MTEAIGTLPPRSRREQAVAVVLVATLALLAMWIDQAAMRFGQDANDFVQEYLSTKLKHKQEKGALTGTPPPEEKLD